MTQIKKIGAGLWAMALAATVGVLPAMAGESKDKVPAFITRLDDAEQFNRCLDAETLASGRALSDVRALLKEKKLGGELLEAVAKYAEGEVAEALQAAIAQDDAAKVDAVYRLLEVKGDDMGAELRTVGIRDKINVLRAKAQDSKCEAPAFLLPGGNPELDWAMANKPALVESMAFANCVVKYLQEHDTAKVEDIVPAASKAALRAKILARLEQSGASAESLQKAKASETLDQLLVVFQISGMEEFDLRHMTQSSVYANYQLSKIYDSGCPVSRSVLDLAEIKAE